MIWAMSTVRRVERWQSRQVVSFQFDSAYMLREAALQVKRAAEQDCEGITVDPLDCVSRMVEADQVRRQRVYETSWAPRRKNVEIEFDKGPLEGKTLVIAHILDPVMGYLSPPISSLFDLGTEPTPYDLTERRVQYGLSGWNDQTRRWVFSPQGGAS